MKQPPHPGEVLLEDFIKPKGITQVKLSEETNVPIQRVNQLINKKRNITPQTAILLAEYFKNTPQFWMHLQVEYDIYKAAEKMRNSKE